MLDIEEETFRGDTVCLDGAGNESREVFHQSHMPHMLDWPEMADAEFDPVGLGKKNVGIVHQFKGNGHT